MNPNMNYCSYEDHSNIEAVYYCMECKDFMCNKCNNFHSKRSTLKDHHVFSLEKNKNISEIFTGFCKEEKHTDKLEYFCKTHNQLCCSGCIAKKKLNNKGQHSDCQIFSLEEIKECKENILIENVKNLEKLLNEVGTLMNEMKSFFEKVNKDKEELKMNVLKIFTKIRTLINTREDEVLLNIDEFFDEYTKGIKTNEIDKYPKKITNILSQGKDTIDKWKNEELNLLINNCIKIENNLSSINDIEKNLKKSREEMSSNIKFEPPEENYIKECIDNLTKFGSIFKTKKKLNLNLNKINDNEGKTVNINIRSTNEETNGLSIHLTNFSNKEYTKYYPENIEYKKDEIILTFLLAEENGNNKKYFNELIKKNIADVDKNDKKLKKAYRKYNNKYYIDLVSKFEEKDINLINSLFSTDIYLEFKNNLTFEISDNTTLEELFKQVGLFTFELKANFKETKDLYESKITKIIKFNKNLDVKYNIISEKLLDFLKSKISDEEFKKNLKFFFGLFLFFIGITMGVFEEKYLDYTNLDQILITVFNSELKSGFVLDIDSKGLNDFYNYSKNLKKQ